MFYRLCAAVLYFMKYFIDFLAELKKGNVAPVYLFYGPEGYLREQAVERLKEYVLPPGGEQLNFEVLDGSVMSGREIVAAAAYASFIPGRRLVLVKSPQIFQASAEKNDREIKYVLDYLAAHVRVPAWYLIRPKTWTAVKRFIRKQPGRGGLSNLPC